MSYYATVSTYEIGSINLKPIDMAKQTAKFIVAFEKISYFVYPDGKAVKNKDLVFPSMEEQGMMPFFPTFSLSSNGFLAKTGNKNGKVNLTLTNISGKRQLGSLSIKKNWQVKALAFSPDNKKLAILLSNEEFSPLFAMNFLLGRDQMYRLYTVDLENNRFQRLATIKIELNIFESSTSPMSDPFLPKPINWSKKGIIHQLKDGKLWLIKEDGKSSIISGKRYDAIYLSPDKERLLLRKDSDLFVNDLSEKLKRIYIFKSLKQISHLEDIPDMDSSQISQTATWLGSRSLSVLDQEGKNLVVKILDAKGKLTKTITLGKFKLSANYEESVSIKGSTDGKYILFSYLSLQEPMGDNDTEDSVFYVIDVKNGKFKKLSGDIDAGSMYGMKLLAL